MNSIDRRAIELEFDNAKFEKNTKSTIKALNDLDSALELKHGTKDLTELERVGRTFSLRNVEDNVDRIASSFTVLGRTIFKIKDQIASSFSGMVFQAKRYADEYIGLLSTMSQANAGFAKYEKKTSAVQAIRSALPDTDLETITKALEDLNRYTDETSYDFTEMVNTIGKFTANGVKLEDAVEAMKGIGNEAAKSGASIQEANRAMYNFAQALATGSVKLIDWKSIENANMATKEFKEQIIDTAVELGVLKKQGDKIRTKKGTLVDFTSFSTTLNEGWFTSDVLTKVLGKYADTTTEFGLAAFHAAQQAKTFTEAIDAVKDAASTGWMKTYELIFGNLEEAIELFTNLANRLIEITDGVSEWRNNLLQGWRDLGGREDLIQGLTDTFEALWNIVRIVGEGIRDIFPETTAEDLKRFTESIKNFGADLRKTFGIKDGVIKVVRSFREELNEEFEELNGTLRYGANGEEVKKLQSRLKELGYDLGDAGVDGIFGPKTEAALKKFQEEYGLAVDGIYGKLSHTKLGELFEKRLVRKFEESEITFSEYSTTMEKLRKIFAGASAVVSMFGKALGFVWNVIKHVGRALSPLADVLLTVLSVFGDWLTNLNTMLDESGLFTDWLETVSKWLEPLSGWLKNAGNSFLRFFGFVKTEEDANDETMTFAKLIADIKQKLQDSGVFDRFAAAIEKIQGAFEKAKTALAGYFESAKQYFKEKFLTKTDDEGNEVVMSYADVLGNIGSFLADAFIGFLDIVSTVIEKIPDGVTKIKDFFADLFGSFDIPAGFEGILKKVTDFFTGIWNAIAAIFGGGESGSVSRKGGKSTRGIKEQNRPDKKNLSQKFDFLEWLANAWNNFISGAGQIFESIADFVERHDIFGKIVNLLLAVQGFFTVKSILNLTAVAKGVVKIGKIFTKTKLQEAKTKKWEAIASTFKSIALVIGVIAASIFILGNMDSEKLMQGVQVVGGILVAIGLFMALARVLTLGNGGVDALGSAGSALKGLAASIAVIVGAIWFLAKMDPQTLSDGTASLVTLAGGLLIFLGLVNGLTINMKGLKEVAIAVAILVGSVFVLGKLMNDSQAVRGVLAIGGILTLLGIFVIAINKFGGSSIKLKGLIGLALAIDIMAAIVLYMGIMPDNVLKKGILALAGIGAILAGLAAVFGSIGKNINVASVGIIAAALAGLMLVLQYVIKNIKDVDPRVMVAFGESLALGLGAIVAACLVASNSKLGGGVKNMASGAAGIVAALDILIIDLAALVGIIGKIDSITEGGLTASIERGGDTLSALANALTPLAGTIDALFLAAAGLSIWNAASGAIPGIGKLKAITGAAVTAASLDILVGNLLLIVGGTGALSQIEKLGLVEKLETAKTTFEKLSDAIVPFTENLNGLGAVTGGFLAASPFVGFAAGQTVLGSLSISASLGIIVGSLEAIVGVNGWLNEITNGGLVDALNSGATVMESLGKALGSFAGGIKAGFASSSYSGYATDLTNFGEAFGALRDNIGGVATLEDGLQADIEAAQAITDKIHGYFLHLEFYPIDYSALSEYATAPRQISTDMKAFGEAIVQFRVGVSKLSTSETIDADVDKAFAVTDSVKRFFDEITGKMPTGDNLVTYTNQLSSLFTNVDIFGTTVGDLSSRLSGVSESGIEANTTSGLEAMTAIGAFFEGVSELKIDPEKPGWKKFFEGDNTTGSFFTQTEALGRSIQAISSSFADLSGSKLIANTVVATASMKKLGKLIEWISTDSSMQWLLEVGDNSPVVKFSEQMTKLGSGVSDFKIWTADFNVEHAQGVANVIKSIAESLSLIGGNENSSASILVGAINTLTGSINDFNTVGYMIDQQLSAGMTGNVDMVSTAASALKKAITDALTLTEEDVANCLTITPVLDMSMVDAGLRSFSGRHISVGAMARGVQRSVGNAEQSQSNNVTNNNEFNASSSVNVTGNTFEIKKEDDINALANKIAALMYQQQRSLGSSIFTRFG